MGEIIELIKASPESLKGVGYLIAYLIAFVVLVERIHNLYSKSSSERRAKRNEDLASLSDLVGDDAALKALCEESKHHEAFSRVARIELSKERRDPLLKILAMGFISSKHVKVLAPYVSKTDEGKYVVTIGLTEMFMAAAGTLGLILVGIVMMTLNFLSGENDASLRLATFLLGAAMIFGIAFMVRDDVQAINLVLRTSKRLEEKGLLAGESGFKAQWKQAWKRGKLGFFILIAGSALIVLIGWLWAHILKG